MSPFFLALHFCWASFCCGVRAMNNVALSGQIVPGERGIALFSTNFVRRGLCATARAT